MIDLNQPVAALRAAAPEKQLAAASLTAQALRDQAGEQALALPDSEGFWDNVARVFLCSDFIARSCQQRPALLAELVTDGLTRGRAEGELREVVRDALAAAGDDEAAMMRALRLLRRREMVRIAWRDLAGYAQTRETLRDLSWLADACIAETLAAVTSKLSERFGTPRSTDGAAQTLSVLGMGKLGGLELNYSSDIDLIFAYPESGQTDGRKQIDNGDYFTRVGQRLIKLLNEATADGFVFRVDMRLRPFGNAGPLALSYDALETYYLTQGREWERYAMIKARVVAGGDTAAEDINQLLRPFVFRRYLDYGAFESLRELKTMIAAEVAKKGMHHNVKLGHGGIREIEFIGQAFQLVRGGREPQLQTRGILDVLGHLQTLGYLPPSDMHDLTEAYDFLRRVENRLQMVNDQQTHVLPTEAAERARLAFAMGYDDWAALEKVLNGHRRRVQLHFEQVFSMPESSPVAAATDPLETFWRGEFEREAASAQLAELGFEARDELAAQLFDLRHGRLYNALTKRARERLDALMPQLLRAAQASEAADLSLSRMLGLVRAIAGRSAYLLVLSETPLALQLLARLFGASPWVAEFVRKHPIVIDELLDVRQFFELPDRAALEVEARRLLGNCAADDTEAQMDALRHFKLANVMRVAALDVEGELPLMRVSDQLTWIAETILQVASDLIWDQMVARHGRPRCVFEGNDEPASFAIVAYGKLGGIELSYGSDLDIVFLHGSRGERQQTDGEKSVDNAVFFARLAQRLVHFIGTLTPAGSCYEVDTRLRPNGASGLLVSSLDAFADYQRGKAWTWEQQALVRARVVVGNSRLRESFAALRSEVLGRERELATLQKEVREMRERMQRELSAGGAEQVDLKQDPGGIADIEFMVQYAVLAWAHKQPDLLTYTDNIRLLEQLDHAALLPAGQAQQLTAAYLHYRQLGHRRALLDQASVVPADDTLAAHRDAVMAVWQGLMVEPPRD